MDFAEAYLLTKLGHPELAGWWGKVLGGKERTFYAIAPKQSGAGDPSPDNVRPILPGLRLIRDDSSTLEVYGGTLDVTNGVLTVTHGRIVYDGSETWTALGAGYYRGLSSMKLGLNNSDALCDRFPFVVTTTVPGLQLGYNGNSSPAVYIRQAQTLTGAASAAELKAWLAEHPVEVVYPLAEPVTYQLTPQEVERAVQELRR